MSIGLYLDNRRVCELPAFCGIQEIFDRVHDEYGIQFDEFYLHQNGRIVSRQQQFDDAQSHCLIETGDVHVALRLRGGKGGFGSMLRAIGAQIEKTTNREACRDLSGRRLRDINEEKRMKNWLDGQKEREDDAEKRRKQKLVKLQTKPKHVFEDAAYEQARQELTQNVSDSVEEGIRKASEVKATEEKALAESKATAAIATGSGVKRKAVEASDSVKKAPKLKKKKNKKKSTLWLGGDISSASDSDSDSHSEGSSSKKQSSGKAAKIPGPSMSKQTAV